MTDSTLSIITASTNRTSHLIECAEAASTCNDHIEHVIIDWASEIPIDRRQLPSDQRLRLLRVEGERSWHASRAYNFAVKQCIGSHILRLDADQIVTQQFFNNNGWQRDSFLANDFTVGDILAPSNTGLVFAPVNRLQQIGGFNEYLVGWGYEDIDLLTRLRGVCSQVPIDIDHCASIDHGDDLRGIESTAGATELPQGIRKSFSNAKNRWLAQSLIWNPSIKSSTYLKNAGNWKADHVPKLPRSFALKSETMARKLELELLFRSPIENFTTEMIYKVHGAIVNPRRYRVANILSFFPRAYARSINWFLRQFIC